MSSGPEKRLAKFGLAVDRGGKDSETDFFSISVWDRQAQLCADYLAKGRRIALEGRLRYSTWEDEGKKRSAVEVVAYRVEFLRRRPGQAGRWCRSKPPSRREVLDRPVAHVRTLADQQVPAAGDDS